MRSVSVTELKAQLSRYLREVRRGGTVQILERGTPIAQLTGISSALATDEGRRARLVKAGILTPGRGDSTTVLDRPPIRSKASVREALLEERADRL